MLQMMMNKYVLRFCYFFNTPIREKTGSCMEARPKGPHTQNGDVTKDSCLQNKTSAAPT